MKAAVCGTNSSEILTKVAKHYNVEPVDAIGNIYETAKITYNYDGVKDVVFNGCVLDYVVNEEDLHPLDEQVVLCALDNLDIIYLYTNNMTEEEINIYHQFDEFFSGKIVDIGDVDAFSIQ